jgi:hypothetical protein
MSLYTARLSVISTRLDNATSRQRSWRRGGLDNVVVRDVARVLGVSESYRAVEERLAAWVDHGAHGLILSYEGELVPVINYLAPLITHREASDRLETALQGGSLSSSGLNVATLQEITQHLGLHVARNNRSFHQDAIRNHLQQRGWRRGELMELTPQLVDIVARGCNDIFTLVSAEFGDRGPRYGGATPEVRARAPQMLLPGERIPGENLHQARPPSLVAAERRAPAEGVPQFAAGPRASYAPPSAELLHPELRPPSFEEFMAGIAHSARATAASRATERIPLLRLTSALNLPSAEPCCICFDERAIMEPCTCSVKVCVTCRVKLGDRCPQCRASLANAHKALVGMRVLARLAELQERLCGILQRYGYDHEGLGLAGIVRQEGRSRQIMKKVVEERVRFENGALVALVAEKATSVSPELFAEWMYEEVLSFNEPDVVCKGRVIYEVAEVLAQAEAMCRRLSERAST